MYASAGLQILGYIVLGGRLPQSRLALYAVVRQLLHVQSLHSAHL